MDKNLNIYFIKIDIFFLLLLLYIYMSGAKLQLIRNV
jgi:YbbR domain-containing protein